MCLILLCKVLERLLVLLLSLTWRLADRLEVFLNLFNIGIVLVAEERRGNHEVQVCVLFPNIDPLRAEEREDLSHTLDLDRAVEVNRVNGRLCWIMAHECTVQLLAERDLLCFME